MQVVNNQLEQWDGVIADLATKRPAALDNTKRPRTQKEDLALEAAMGSPSAKKQLEKVNSELTKAALDVDDLQMATAKAEAERRKAAENASALAEAERRKQIGEALAEYLGFVREI